MPLNSYTIKTRLGTTIIPKASSLYDALGQAAEYHRIEPLYGTPLFSTSHAEAFWNQVGQKGMSVKIGKPKPLGTDITHKDPKPKRESFRASRSLKIGDRTAGKACRGCGAFNFYLDVGDTSDPRPMHRCKECEREVGT